MQDPTRTKTYAHLDLAAKVLSAIALVVLGIAGWLFQVRTEQAKQAREELERQERLYLPMLRSLTELEFALPRLARKIQAIKVKRPDALHAREELRAELEYLADSLFLPDGDPMVTLSIPGNYIPGVGWKPMQAPLRSALLTYAQLITVQNFGLGIARDRVGKNATVTFLGGDVGIQDENGRFLGLSTRPEARAVWDMLLREDLRPGDRGRPRGALSNFEAIHLDYQFGELRVAVARVIHETLQRYPDLGDRYIGIRASVIENERFVQ